jgi:predicted DCC family thiol-disulfide oxidoreductase YuxK
MQSPTLPTHSTGPFSLDVRSLALFRICLALITLCFAWPSFPSWLTLEDVEFWAESYFGVGPLTQAASAEVLLLLRLSTIIVGFSNLIVILAALALLFGYRTQLATLVVGLGLFIISFPFLGIWGDSGRGFAGPVGYVGLITISDGIRLMPLICGIFLPLGARYSMDYALSLKAPEKELQNRFADINSIRSVATIIFCLQAVLFYLLWYWPSNNFVSWASVEGVLLGGIITFFVFVICLSPRFTDVRVLVAGIFIFGYCFSVFRNYIPVPNFHRSSYPSVTFYFSYSEVQYPYLSLCNAAVWMALLPSGFWDYFARKFANRPEVQLLAFYDGDCGFCRRTVRFMQTFLGVPHTSIAIGQSDPRIFEIMERESSWVVRDSRGKTYTEFAAILRFVEASPAGPLLRPFTWWWRKPRRLRMGNRLYRFVADNRDKFGHATAFLTPGTIPLQIGRKEQILLVLCFLCLVLWHVPYAADNLGALLLHELPLTTDYNGRLPPLLS